MGKHIVTAQMADDHYSEFGDTGRRETPLVELTPSERKALAERDARIATTVAPSLAAMSGFPGYNATFRKHA